MKAILLICALFASLSVQAADSKLEGIPVRSFDGEFEVYEMPGWTEMEHGKLVGCGTKLYLRAAGSKLPGVLLRQNDRWMSEQWCPELHLLAVVDSWDTHQADVYVYEVSRVENRGLNYKLVFKSPWNDRDRQWSVEGWEPKARAIRLKLEQRGDTTILGHENWPPYVERHVTLRIGTKPISDTTR